MALSLFKMNLILKAYGLFKIPLIAFVGPKLVELTDSKSVVKIGLGFRTKNHLGVMYFGALAIGAELSIALKAVEAIQLSGKRIDFLFKDFKIEFLKRADGDVHFTCEEAGLVRDLILKSVNSNERFEQKFSGYAVVPSKSNEPVIKYELTLSIKNRSRPKESLSNS